MVRNAKNCLKTIRSVNNTIKFPVSKTQKKEKNLKFNPLRAAQELSYFCPVLPLIILNQQLKNTKRVLDETDQFF